jgi:hypothetical protein
VSAHPNDILVVCWSEERRIHPQFENRQVVVAGSPDKILGRSFRIAWVTDPAISSTNTRFWDALMREVYFRDAEIRNISEYKEGA